jgi:UDP-2-acetamido-2-deoxy-ribo-hexuluronate aminotransferase
MDFIDLKSQYRAYQDEIDAAVRGVMSSAQFIMGPEHEKLEHALSAYVGCAHTLACSSGTDALLLALMALEIGPGDEVITPPFTFIATAEAIAFVGAKPVFVDIDAGDFNIDSSLIEAAITPKTRAIMPVSLYGQCADMAAINAIADRHNLAVIEDGCQSFGATYKGRRSGNLCTIGTTSFFPSKPLGAYGDGGAVFTSDRQLADRIRQLRNHGQSARYEHTLIGMNGRLDAMQAAILNVKLRHFDGELERREALRQRYDRALGSAGVMVPQVLDDRTTVCAQYSIRSRDRAGLIGHLTEAGVPTAVHYPKPLHLQPAFGGLGYRAGDFPVSEQVSSEVLSLPFSPFLTEADQDRVIEAILSYKESGC